MKYPIELIDLNYQSCASKLSNEAYSKGFDKIQELLNNLLNSGIMPRIGDRLVSDEFDECVVISSICYSSHKIMIECEFESIKKTL